MSAVSCGVEHGAGSEDSTFWKACEFGGAVGEDIQGVTNHQDESVGGMFDYFWDELVYYLAVVFVEI